jgi:N-glycosylase/DNA lyase
MRRAVSGHGWFDLPPFSWDPASGALTRTLALPDGAPATVIVTAAPGWLKLRLTTMRPLDRAGAAAARRAVAHMLRMEEHFDQFYDTARNVPHPDLRWAGEVGAGRLLRGPTVYEDLIKMLCTTNCTWALTRIMVHRLVERLGAEAPLGLRTFPSPEAMASRPVRFYRDGARAGYRAPFLREVAIRVARRRCDPESWLLAARPTEEIRREILDLPGAGPYVADNLLKLLGRYEGLGIDSWCRRRFAEMHTSGRRVGDRRIARFYAPFGRWAGLALWCDITRDWIDGPGPPAPILEKFPGSAD